MAGFIGGESRPSPTIPNLLNINRTSRTGQRAPLLAGSAAERRDNPLGLSKAYIPARSQAQQGSVDVRGAAL